MAADFGERMDVEADEESVKISSTDVKNGIAQRESN